MSDNLYQPPSAPISASGYSTDASISPLVIQHLARTQPWVRLISIVGLIMTCIVLAGMLFFPVLLGATSRRSGLGGAEMTLAVIPALIMGILFLYPLLKLSKYAAAIRRLRQSLSNADLEDALDQQRAFWKFYGVLMMIGIIFWVFSVLMALAASATRL